MGGGLGGGQKVDVEKVYVLFSVPYYSSRGGETEIG